MKSLICSVVLFCSLVVAQSNDPLQNRLNAAATECKKELGAQQGTQEIMALLSSGALPTNEKQRCFLECVYNKIGLIKDNRINEEGAMSLAKQKFGENKDLMGKADALFKKCKTEAVVDKDSKEKCALGRLVRTCIVNHGNNGALPIRWMAPESLHYSCYTYKTDVWSFGILIWEIITLGSLPYASMGARIVMRKVKDGYRLEKPKHCKTTLFNIINKCWHSDPIKWPSFTDLKQDLLNLLENAEHQGNYVDLDTLVEEMNQAVQKSHNEKFII